MKKITGVSIVIVNWNGNKWLERLLDSVMSQDYEDYEVIFVDNDSSDGSVTFVKHRYPTIRLIQNEKNAGFAGGNNLGISHAKKEWIMMLNTDVWVKPDFVSELMAFAIDGGYDVVGPQEADYTTAKKRPQYITRIDLLGHPVFIDIENKDNVSSFFISGVCLAFPKKLYTESRGLDANFFMYVEEVDWFWRLLLLKKKISYDPNSFVYHWGGGSTKKGLNYNTFLWRNQNTLQMLIKNYAWYSLVVVIPFFLLQNVVEMIGLCFVGKFKLAASYPYGWMFNVRHLSRTLRARKYVQNSRQVSDMQIIRHMYIGPGKLRHLIKYAGKK